MGEEQNDREEDAEQHPSRRWKKIGFRLARIVFAVVALLFFFQGCLIYHPRQYDGEDFVGAPKNLREISFTTSQGDQSAWYIPPRTAMEPNERPERLWVLFGGNAMTALDWRWFVKNHPDAVAGFLLIDFPGYGNCEGRPSPESILENSTAAYTTLAKSLGIAPEELDQHLYIMGHSLGSAAALQFAATRPNNQGIVICAPFTSLRAMATRVVGWPLCYLLRHNFDNRARLTEISKLADPPRVLLIHGTDDEVIPFSMGESLAEEFPDLIEFRPLPGAGHNDLFHTQQKPIYEAMQRMADFTVDIRPEGV